MNNAERILSMTPEMWTESSNNCLVKETPMNLGSPGWQFLDDHGPNWSFFESSDNTRIEDIKLQLSEWQVPEGASQTMIRPVEIADWLMSQPDMESNPLESQWMNSEEENWVTEISNPRPF